MDDFEQSQFIGEEVKVEFDKPPALEKTPGCPDRIRWGEELLMIEQLLAEWRDYGRRGRMSSNMRPENLTRARQRGSWGVGRFFFRVRVADGRCFELYYDRAPQGTRNRKGNWYLFREIFGDEPISNGRNEVS